MTEFLEHLQEAKELLANIILAYDTDDQVALEGFITQAQEFVSPRPPSDSPCWNCGATREIK